jgi:hypothetical protein
MDRPIEGRFHVAIFVWLACDVGSLVGTYSTPAIDSVTEITNVAPRGDNDCGEVKTQYRNES